MRRPSLILALLALLVAAGCAGLLGWVLIEPGRWLPDADSRAEVATLQRQVASLQREVDGLEREVNQQRPYVVALSALCNAFRTITGLNRDEYAIVVARALVRGVVESCDYGEVLPGAVLRP